MTEVSNLSERREEEKETSSQEAESCRRGRVKYM